MTPTHAVIVFVDIRGFTQWMSHVATVYVLDECIQGLMTMLREHFPKAMRKGLGDGALLVCQAPSPPHASAIEALLLDTLTHMAGVEQRFAALCQHLTHRSGHPTRLQLGWGVSRGLVQPIGSDFLGMPLNEASRLCDLARPAGAVLHRGVFPQLPDLAGLPWSCVAAEVPVRGLPGALPVWISHTVRLEGGTGAWGQEAPHDV